MRGKIIIVTCICLFIGGITGYLLRDYEYRKDNKKTQKELEKFIIPNTNKEGDPLGIYGKPNPELYSCLDKVNSRDPLGLLSTNDEEEKERKYCLDKYQKSKK